MKMSMNSLILFLCILMCGYAVENEPILLQISSGTSYCNNDKLFHNFDLSEVSQFGAMCNIPIPKSKQVDFLLENNVVPILCMGLFDVSLRLCKSASDDTLPFMDIFPPTTEKFAKLFSTLDNSDTFASLNKFCSSTVKSHIITKPASNVTELWWNMLNSQLKEEDSCMKICRTNDNNKVHPLCSYIIWSNGIYLNHQKNQEESQATATSVEEKFVVGGVLLVGAGGIVTYVIYRKRSRGCKPLAPAEPSLPKEPSLESETRRSEEKLFIEKLIFQECENLLHTRLNVPFIDLFRAEFNEGPGSSTLFGDNEAGQHTRKQCSSKQKESQKMCLLSTSTFLSTNCEKRKKKSHSSS